MLNIKKINKHEITIFSRQMATMIAAGLPLIQAFDVIEKGAVNNYLKKLVATIKYDIEASYTFAEALQKHPAYFSSLFCSLIEAGEKSGALAIMLNKVATYQEKLDTVRKKITRIMAYPLTVLLMALLITVGLLLFVIPQFAVLFNTFGAELPFLTQGVIYLSHLLQNHGFFILGTSMTLIGGVFYSRKNFPHFSHYWDKALLKLPVLGRFLVQSIIVRFSRTLAVTLSAGLPLMQALHAAGNVTGNSVYQLASYRIQDAVSYGQSLRLALENAGIFPALVIQMIAIGEESGTLEAMLNKIADYYEGEINNAVESLNILLEPFIMAILGIVIGTLLLAVYVPIFKLGSIM
ncbi:type II secretion system F family protein [Legionella clemsonensis]|uniref:Type II secretion system protein F n=1 Tax=Legionella clemsonensis TaxID=1867846 RepID=A0A222P1Y9_9GAMM|nr:type II secretion system F family protein [Legionella clemsonensis]ASQ45874.1 Type II secretion system protein F [Legionella clemsonensis]